MSEIFNIESLDLEARGIARREGKTIFVENALPQEIVTANIFKKKSSYEIAQTQQVLKNSFLRVIPKCPYFGTCGGCSMQHLESSAQVAVKQRVLEDCFEKIGKIKIPKILAPIYGPTWNYRYRARLSVRYVTKKGGILIGFREKKGRFVTDMHECHILPKKISNLLPKLRECFSKLSICDRIPQLEVAVGKQQDALIIRHMAPFSENDLELLHSFSKEHDIAWWLQPKGPETVHPLNPSDENKLFYDLPEFGLRMFYRPTDFTQVNHQINQALVSLAIRLLKTEPTDRVADLFCGLGNFSLPLATQVKEVVGIEGSESLTQRAQSSAEKQGLSSKVNFSTLNLFEIDKNWLESLAYFDRILIDPPRDGAQALVTALSELKTEQKPKRIVYVSCKPSTLARDANILTYQGGYKLLAAGIVNMFPHTAHVESIAVFES